MHDHKYLIEMLKTPKGYLTTEGFTYDIDDKNIIFCASNTYGKWSDTKDRIPYFAKKYTGNLNILEILNSIVDKIETYGIYCNKGTLCVTGCEPQCKNTCPYWNWPRNLGMFYRHY